jgi:beta-lactamase class A
MRQMAAGIVLLVLWGLAESAFCAQHYDVSYLWHSDRTQVLKYRDKVAHVLGPAVAKKLLVVKSGGLYGLIYRRGGDSAGASRVAAVHTRLLRKKGLEAAAPVRSKNWNAEVADLGRKASETSTGLNTTTNYGAPQLKDLEHAIEAHIKQLRQQGSIASDERTGWSVYDFTTGRKLVTINEDLQFEAASLIKPFLATAFFDQVKRGKLVYDARARRHLERMIQHSSNRAANWVMRRIGGPKAAQRILKRHYPGIFRQTRIVEYIPANGRTYRNKASAHDYSRFLYALWSGDLPRSSEIKRLMALPGPDRIYMGVSEIPGGTKVYNKTGSTARLCGDMGILSVRGKDGKRYPYTVIGIIEKRRRAANYPRWIHSRGAVIRDISSLVYERLAQHHNLKVM